MEGDFERHLHAGREVALNRADGEVGREALGVPPEAGPDVAAVDHGQLTHAGGLLHDGSEGYGVSIELDVYALAAAVDDKQRLG